MTLLSLIENWLLSLETQYVCWCRAGGIWMYIGDVTQLGHTVDSTYIFTLWPYLGQDRRQWRIYPLSSRINWTLGTNYVCWCRARGIWMYIGFVTQLGHTGDSTYLFTLWPYLGQDRRQWRLYPLSNTHMTSHETQYVCWCRAGGIWIYIGVVNKIRPYSGHDVSFHTLSLLLGQERRHCRFYPLSRTHMSCIECSH